MADVQACDLPSTALLRTYRDGGGYADCYVAKIDGHYTHAQFVAAFYTTWLFKLERGILRWLARKPSSDAQAAQLAQGAIDTFAAWQVEARAPDQILLADYIGRTRSWLMVAHATTAEPVRTLLYFGSAVVPKRGTDGARRLGIVFAALLGFHRLYSRMLLRAARARLSAPLA